MLSTYKTLKLQLLWLCYYSWLLWESPWPSWHSLCNNYFYLQEKRSLINMIIFLKQGMPMKVFVHFPIRYLCIWIERMNPHCANSFILILYYKQNIHSRVQKLFSLGWEVEYTAHCACAFWVPMNLLYFSTHTYPSTTELWAWLQRKILLKVNRMASGCTMSAEISGIIKEFVFIIFAENVCILPILYSTPLN